MYVIPTPFTIQHRPFTQVSLVCLSFAPLATGFPVTPPEPGPAPSPASGFRPSGLLTPVFPGVPTGARNLGVCVFSCFAFNPYYRLSVFSLSISLHLCYRTFVAPTVAQNLPSATAFSYPRFHLPSLTLCYRSLSLFVPHHLLPPPPTFVYSFPSRTLVFPSHTTYEPHGASASPVGTSGEGG